MLAEQDRHFPVDRVPCGLNFNLIAGPSLVMNESELQCVLDQIPPAGRLLELGTWTGATACWLLDRRDDIQVVSVDNCPPDEQWQRMLMILINKYHRPRWTIWWGSIAAFFAWCLPQGFSVVLVDASHEREMVFEDLTFASTAVRPGGVIVAHDYGDPSEAADDYQRDIWGGVRQAVDSFCGNSSWRVAEVVGSMAVLKMA